MKPAPFEYYAPTSVAETVALLEQHGPEAKVLAGGQSLVPLLNMRLARPLHAGRHDVPSRRRGSG